MSNRKARRAQAQARAPSPDIPLSHPSRAAPTHKTLLDLASERHLLNHPKSSSSPPLSISTTTLNPDGTLSTPPAAEDDPPPPLWPDTLLYTLTLTLLHFTLTLLVHNQYSPTPPSLPSLLYGSTIATPTPLILGILVHLLHPRSSQGPVQVLFAVLNVVAGVWLVKASNEDAYLAVMRKAPPLGTLWVWAVVELRWEVAAGGLVGVGGWAWWMGYGFT